jgi:hypothetical protein
LGSAQAGMNAIFKPGRRWKRGDQPQRRFGRTGSSSVIGMTFECLLIWETHRKLLV